MNTQIEDGESVLTNRKHRALQMADTSLIASPLQGRWWRITKRMIEQGSERFWRRRGMVVPGGETFAARRQIEVAAAASVAAAAAAQRIDSQQ